MLRNFVNNVLHRRHALRATEAAKGSVGGMVGEASEICNFPSYDKISGFELVSKMIAQVKNLGVEIKQEEVIGINRGNNFEVKTNNEKYSAKKIILATGSERRKLNLFKYGQI